jgi:hypothetical protein
MGLRVSATPAHYGYMQVEHDTILERLRSDTQLRLAVEAAILIIRRRGWLRNPASQAALRRLSRVLAQSKTAARTP